ncbi:MAG: TRAP transporter small permease [Hyphomicrobiaceae bacterium]
MRGALAAYRRLNDWLQAAVVAFTGFVVLVIVVAPLVAAIVRYYTGQGYDWLAEMPPQLVPWVVFPMMGVLLRHDRHISVDIAPYLLSGRAYTLLRALVLAISLAACIVFGWYGAESVAFFRRLGQLSTTEIEFELWYLYISYPVGFALAANFCLEALLHTLAGQPAPGKIDPELGGLA